MVQHGSERWLVAPYGEVSWVQNARAAGRVWLARGRRREECEIAEVNPIEAGPVLLEYVTMEPITRPFFDAPVGAPVAAFAANAATHPGLLTTAEGWLPTKSDEEECYDGSGDSYLEVLEVRRQVLGDAYVDANLAESDEFMMTFQRLVTEQVWGRAWSGTALDKKTKSLLTIGILSGAWPVSGGRDLHERCLGLWRNGR